MSDVQISCRDLAPPWGAMTVTLANDRLVACPNHANVSLAVAYSRDHIMSCVTPKDVASALREVVVETPSRRFKFNYFGDTNLSYHLYQVMVHIFIMTSWHNGTAFHSAGPFFTISSLIKYKGRLFTFSNEIFSLMILMWVISCVLSKS